MVSIIVPIYNAERYLSKCIESIINQDYRDIEVLLVDDGSTDSSCSICKHYCALDSRIKFIQQNNSGVSATRNKGIKAASGEYIMFVDSDDYMEQTVVSCVVQSNTYINADIVIFNYYKIAADKKTKCDSVIAGLKTKDQFLEDCYNNLNTVYYNKIYNKLYKRKIIIDNNIIFPENMNMGEDFRFNLLYFSKCKLFLMIDDYLYNYRIDNGQSLMHKVNRLSISDTVEEINSTLNFFKENTVDCALCSCGIDKYILDKVNGYIVLSYRAKVKNTKQLSECLRLIKMEHTIKDFSSVRFPAIMKLGWKFQSGVILYIRQVIIDKRYKLIMMVKRRKDASNY